MFIRTPHSITSVCMSLFVFQQYNFITMIFHIIIHMLPFISPISFDTSSYLSMCSITMTSQWARWRLKSPASPLFTHPFIRAQIKENIRAPRHWPLCGEFTGDRWIPRTNGQWRGKCFYLMTSSRIGMINAVIHMPQHQELCFVISIPPALQLFH